ncbi:hypothetical protein [Streptomyces sp. NPDC058773]|uniref:hypothetical protein n=1 Tax=Streptomyces sp. NPDC058773 TaxID=3346632 RepID=UPI003678F2F7
MVEQAVRPVVEAIVAHAPTGWTHAVLHGRAARLGLDTEKALRVTGTVTAADG